MNKPEPDEWLMGDETGTYLNVDGEWELVEVVIEKAKNWDIKEWLTIEDRLEAIKDYAKTLTRTINGIYTGDQIRTIGSNILLKAAGIEDEL